MTRLADERWTARTAKDWAAADAGRTALLALGWQVRDSAEGYSLEPVLK